MLKFCSNWRPNLQVREINCSIWLIEIDPPRLSLPTQFQTVTIFEGFVVVDILRQYICFLPFDKKNVKKFDYLGLFSCD